MPPFQTFEATTRPADGPPRLARLRAELARRGLHGFLVPRADAWQGEYVAACDARLAWLTGFTGSAGFCVVLPDAAGLFVDGRYRVQARTEVDTAAFTPIDRPETRPGPWLRARLPEGGKIGYDPWLHTADEIRKLTEALEGSGVTLCATDNPVDAIWHDRPPRPAAPARAHPEALAGTPSADKRAAIAAALAAEGQRAAVLSLPDSLCWLLNLRGADLPRVPVVQAWGIVHDDASVDVFADPAKFAGLALDPGVRVAPAEGFAAALAALGGPVRVDPATAPEAIARALEAAGVAVAPAPDPCLLPKARKTAAELAGARAAHRRDGAAMAAFLAWFDAEAPTGGLTEIDLVRRLEAARAATGRLRDIAFDTIAGAGPHGAIVHYRVTEATDRAVAPGEAVLVDSGGQYEDGTTDITRTLLAGPGPAPAPLRDAATRVLQGMIALARARFPRGVTGAHLDALARYPLWLAGLDYDHGTGHGVGSFLSVHEGPQRLSRTSDVALEPGMIVSDEPGHYREGAWGIRFENLVAVIEAPAVAGGDPGRAMLAFETLTLAPFDRRLIDAGALDPGERAWLDAYHARVLAEIGPLVAPEVRAWLEAACAPL